MSESTERLQARAHLAMLATEQADPRYAGIERLSTLDLARTMNEADGSVSAAVAAVLPDVAAAIDAVADRLVKGGRLRYVGAGTAGRMAVMDAAECPPTFSTDPELVKAVLAGGKAAEGGAVEGTEDDAAAGAAAMAAEGIGPGDAVVGLAASGRTPFVVAAVEEARRRGALTVGFSCNTGTVLSEAAEFRIEVAVGPEVVAGSTRLKSGTAQKFVLNMISTISMVRLGKVYRNYMVDMRVANSKLAVRAVRMIREITGAGPEAAEAALAASGNRVKTAVVMLELGVGAEEAEERLGRAEGRLAGALTEAAA
ncbi:N-acetylmuramic acid 6-phosphate etherase [Glycomyces harbinensis]|uniref:N-acetylmuramic acid 6-phosphate etherase n=1 Tax=Glycomyces harbinensis TaxID=58114 RepID=A0A1G7BV73_9ACTN|nr:N-acetylmuramic acid 6-phosphate etherase [Glycomyces harbinensis]SDE30095.1 N-acetylmuramic acid 6-phosphate etherase [Glycomyces harbinensis]